MCNTAPGSEPTPPPLLPRWQELRTRLKTSPGREFERNAWPLLHIIAPQVRLAPELGDLDRAGLDAVEPERHGHGLAHAFQMKSAASPRFRFSSFVKGCRKSLADFVRSGHRAREFIFIVNAWGREPEILAEIEPDLRRLHTEGKAEGVTFCSVDDFVQKALFEARSHISFATQYAATALHVEALTGDFRDFEPLRSVPARVAFLEVDPRSGVHERSAQMREDFDPVELGELGASGNGTRKTLLTGMFGS